jgi:hypothetical protein
MTLARSGGMRTFSVIWFGQLVSMLGTGMTSFALSLWAWGETGSATTMSLLLFFAVGPAFSASITLMVPREQHSRANGMMTLVHYIPEVVAPLSAASLVQAVGIGRIMMIDLLTFGLAVAMTFLVTIPQPETSAEGRAAHGSLWSESVYGFRYILARPGLLGLQLVFLVINVAGVFQWVLQSPMILARTGQDSRALGVVLSAAGIGSVIGGLVMSAWSGPKRRIHGVLGGMALECLLGITLMGLARTLPVWALAGFLTMLFVPVLNSSNQAIWQAKVPPDVQGKVFAARRRSETFSPTSPLRTKPQGPATRSRRSAARITKSGSTTPTWRRSRSSAWNQPRSIPSRPFQRDRKGACRCSRFLSPSPMAWPGLKGSMRRGQPGANHPGSPEGGVGGEWDTAHS